MRGSFTMNVAPSASVDRTWISPECARTISRTMNSPSPRPSVFCVARALPRRNGSKIGQAVLRVSLS